MFFIAIRARDYEAVTRMLKEQPELANAMQNWEPELSRQHVVPYPNKASALITAVELDDPQLLKILLDAGADPNGQCGCATGEAPLWTAVLFNRPEHARLLLKHDANPNVTSAVGNQPLHLAAMRGYGELAELLIQHGAQPDALDAGAKWPVPTPAQSPAEWADINGFPAIAEMIRQHSPAQRKQNVMRQSTKVAPISDEIIHTGIKAIDLFTPIQRGGLLRIPFAAGVGMIVMLGELSYRWSQHDGGAVIWSGFAQTPMDRMDIQAELDEVGISDEVTLCLASQDETEEQKQQAFEQGLARAEALRDEGQDVMLVFIASEGYTHQLESRFPQLLAKSPKGSITTMFITTISEQQVWETLKPPFTGQIALDVNRAKKYLFPTIDPEKSLISETSRQALSSRHTTLIEQARNLLLDYQAHDPTLESMDTMRDSVAVKLLRYFAQPFFIAEPFTGTKGVHVSQNVLLDELETLLDEAK
ncbi:MAG: ankyrin repeat domain-containing protein [Pseudomonadota bacterium]